MPFLPPNQQRQSTEGNDRSTNAPKSTHPGFGENALKYYLKTWQTEYSAKYVNMFNRHNRHKTFSIKCFNFLLLRFLKNYFHNVVVLFAASKILSHR